MAELAMEPHQAAYEAAGLPGMRRALAVAMVKSRDIRVRSFEFAVAAVAAYRAVCRRDPDLRRLGAQMLDASASIGANLEEAKGAQSRADFIAKVNISLKEAREARYWLRLVWTCCPGCRETTAPMATESSEIIAMLVAALKTASARRATTPLTARVDRGPI